MSDNSGGYAFPQQIGNIRAGGLTLRDYFAGQALSGYLADPTVGGDPMLTAFRMYEFADAMLKARE